MNSWFWRLLDTAVWKKNDKQAIPHNILHINLRNTRNFISRPSTKRARREEGGAAVGLDLRFRLRVRVRVRAGAKIKLRPVVLLMFACASYVSDVSCVSCISCVCRVCLCLNSKWIVS